MELVYYLVRLILCTVFLSSFRNGCYSQDVKPEGGTISKRQKVSGRTSVGEIISGDAYPFKSVLFNPKTGSVCGATLISAKWLLTAASCLTQGQSVFCLIGYGTELDMPETTHMELMSKHFIFHDKFDLLTKANDIALVKLPKAVPINEHIKTVTYARGMEKYINKIANTVTFLVTFRRRDFSPLLLTKFSGRLLSNEECGKHFPNTVIGPGHVCLWDDETVGPCEEEKGSPLLVDNVLVGFKSYSDPDCNGTTVTPTVFTRIAHYHDWIQNALAVRSSGHLCSPIQFQLIFVQMYALYKIAI